MDRGRRAPALDLLRRQRHPVSSEKSYLKPTRRPGGRIPQAGFELTQPGFEEIWSRAKEYASKHGFTVGSVTIEALAQFLDREVES